MPTFIYKAKKGPKDIITGEIVAETQDHAVNKLEEMALSPISVVESEGAGKQILSREPGRVSPDQVRVKMKDVDALTWQLASLVRARVPILRALALISQQTENRALNRVVTDLKNQVKDGRTLSQAMGKYPRLFNNLFLSMIKSGEQGGVLDEVLYKIAEHREKEQALRRKVQTALAYPMVMLFVGIATVFIMLTFFLPKFVGIFENMKQKLPLPTEILITISQFMSSYWQWFLIAFAFAFVIFGRARPSSKKKFLFDLIKLHMPFMKKFVRDAEIAKFCRTLGLLMKNGLPVYESLELATDTLDNDALRDRLGRVGKEIIQQGSTLSSSLDKVKIFPNFAVNMIAVGEEGGKLEESLTEIANAYEREVEQAVNVMTSLIEPVLILIIGSVVGFIVFAMLLPIFDIGVMAK